MASERHFRPPVTCNFPSRFDDKKPDSLIKSTLFKGDVMLSYTKICGKNGKASF